MCKYLSTCPCTYIQSLHLHGVLVFQSVCIHCLSTPHPLCLTLTCLTLHRYGKITSTKAILDKQQPGNACKGAQRIIQYIPHLLCPHSSTDMHQTVADSQMSRRLSLHLCSNDTYEIAVCIVQFVWTVMECGCGF